MKENFISKINHFWFEEISPKQRFQKDESFDALLADKFGNLVQDALGARLDSWASSKEGTLALILLLDQMTRNIYRDTPLAFAGDEMAVAHSLNAVQKGFLDEDHSAQNQFMLMPLMHSEDLTTHQKAQPLFATYTSEMVVDYLDKHRVIIERFGRYPHRNAILGRPSTEEEIAFLETPNSSF